MQHFYEEHCQLGFTDHNADFDFQDHSYEPAVNENLNINNTLPKRQQQPSGKIIQVDHLKAQFEKKVAFGEQLSFGFLNPDQLQFESEMQQQPKAIEFKKAAAQQKKKAPNQKMGFLEAHIQNMIAGKKAKKVTQIQGAKKDQGEAANRPLPEFNLDTRPAKYFDANIDPKSKREQQRIEKSRQFNDKPKTSEIRAQTGQPIFEKGEGGKIEVGYMKSNGKIGEKFEVYNNLDDIIPQRIVKDTQLSMKKMFPQQAAKKLTSALSPSKSSDKKQRASSGGKRNIQIAKSEVAFNQDQYLQKLHQEDHLVNVSQSSSKKGIESAIYTALGGQEVDVRLHGLVNQALNQKEAMIKVLEDQLNAEKQRREAITNKFKQQLEDFEAERDALERLRRASNQLEKKHTNNTHASQISISANNLTELDMIPTKESHRSKPKTSKAALLAFKPERVKSSIPKLKVEIPQTRSSTKSIPTAGIEQQARYLEDLQVQEVQRSLKIQRDEKIAEEVVRKLRDNPNEHIHQMQNEVAMLNRKVQPLLERVEQAAKNVKIANSNNIMAKGPLGMLSKMGGRLINFYADDLAELLLQDFLAETAVELQSMESKQLKNYAGEEAKMCAETLMKNLVDYQSEEALISMRWQNPAQKLKKGQQQSKPHQPAGIAFNLANNEEFQEIEDSNPFTKHSATAVDPFSMKLKENNKQTTDSLKTSAKPLEFDSQLLKYEEPKRKWKINMDKGVMHSITLYREKYEKYLKMHNNTASKEVWKVYDHIAADIFHELFQQSLTQVQKDMEEYIDKVIVDEFQIGV